MKNYFSKNIISEIINDGFAVVKLMGFANSATNFKDNNRKIGVMKNRAPEILLGTSFEMSADLWSAGCLIYKTISGRDLFFVNGSRRTISDDFYLRLIVNTFGRLPSTLLYKKPGFKVILD